MTFYSSFCFTAFVISRTKSHATRAALLVDEKGRLYTWGSNQYNKLGLGPNTSEVEPLPRVVEAFKNVKIVDSACGDYHTCAVDSEGKLYSWGWGGSTLKGCGGLGHEGAQDEVIPRLVQALADQVWRATPPHCVYVGRAVL